MASTSSVPSADSLGAEDNVDVEDEGWGLLRRPEEHEEGESATQESSRGVAVAEAENSGEQRSRRAGSTAAPKEPSEPLPTTPTTPQDTPEQPTPPAEPPSPCVTSTPPHPQQAQHTGNRAPAAGRSATASKKGRSAPRHEPTPVSDMSHRSAQAVRLAVVVFLVLLGSSIVLVPFFGGIAKMVWCAWKGTPCEIQILRASMTVPWLGLWFGIPFWYIACGFSVVANSTIACWGDEYAGDLITFFTQRGCITRLFGRTVPPRHQRRLHTARKVLAGLGLLMLVVAATGITYKWLGWALKPIPLPPKAPAPPRIYNHEYPQLIFAQNEQTHQQITQLQETVESLVNTVTAIANTLNTVQGDVQGLTVSVATVTTGLSAVQGSLQDLRQRAPVPAAANPQYSEHHQQHQSDSSDPDPSCSMESEWLACEHTLKATEARLETKEDHVHSVLRELGQCQGQLKQLQHQELRTPEARGDNDTGASTTPPPPSQPSPPPPHNKLQQQREVRAAEARDYDDTAEGEAQAGGNAVEDSDRAVGPATVDRIHIDGDTAVPPESQGGVGRSGQQKKQPSKDGDASTPKPRSRDGPESDAGSGDADDTVGGDGQGSGFGEAHGAGAGGEVGGEDVLRVAEEMLRAGGERVGSMLRQMGQWHQESARVMVRGVRQAAEAMEPWVGSAQQHVVEVMQTMQGGLREGDVRARMEGAQQAMVEAAQAVHAKLKQAKQHTKKTLKPLTDMLQEWMQPGANGHGSGEDDI